MNLPKPSIIAVRAVRQYRCRDIVSYLALRYYLESRSARRERWPNDVASSVVMRRSARPYFFVKHFKERDGEGVIHHRELHLPCANEILAEGVLLAECSKHNAFENAPSVFSYELSKGVEFEGMFRPYFGGLQRRQKQIAMACRSDDDLIVLYGDVRRFYPSISHEVAANAWKSTCEEAHLVTQHTDLGVRLIEDYSFVDKRHGSGILTGPMFSHLIGNLVMKPVDEAMAGQSRVSYFRYVDDVVLVGPLYAVRDAYEELGQRLGDMGLELHPEGSGKHLQVSASEWLQGEDDFADTTQPIQWKSLVHRLKCLLLGESARHETIRMALRAAGFRLPLPNYAGVIREQSYLARMKGFIESRWIRGKTGRLTQVVEEAEILRDRYLRGLDVYLEQIRSAVRYQRKRLLPNTLSGKSTCLLGKPSAACWAC